MYATRLPSFLPGTVLWFTEPLHRGLQSQVDPTDPSLSPPAPQPPGQSLPVFLLDHS